MNTFAVNAAEVNSAGPTAPPPGPYVMANVTGTIQPSFNFQQTPLTGILAGNPLTLADQLRATFGNGILADQVNLFSVNNLTFVASTAQTLNLRDGTQKDAQNANCVFARVRAVLVKIYSTTDAASLTVGAATTNPWTGFLGATSVLTVPAASAANPNGGFFLIVAPNTTGMAAGTSSCQVLLTPSAHAFTADVYFVGSDT